MLGRKIWYRGPWKPQHEHIKPAPQETPMSKGMDRKKETKKKPGKTLEEKRAIKQAKRAERKR